MKRSEIVKKLISEGFSEKTLATMSDNQLNMMSERILGEQVTTIPGKPAYKVGDKGGSLPPSPKGYSVTIDPVDKKPVAQPMESEMKEELKGGQKKLDKNHNGKIDAQDFKILKGKKSEVKEKEEKVNPSASKRAEQVAQGAYDGRFKEKVVKDKKKEASKNWAKGKDNDLEETEIKGWVDSLVENEYYSFTSKNEIMEMITSKLNEQYPEIAEPDTETEVEPDIDAPPHEAPDDDPFHDPWQNPGEGPDPRPKFEKQDGGNLPDFMTFKNIINSFN